MKFPLIKFDQNYFEKNQRCAHGKYDVGEDAVEENPLSNKIEVRQERCETISGKGQFLYNEEF
ncbi:hypothetical protein TYRP_022876 [Tyrophagus putrescentiae]|nr:hypothetical protein TYRP_022876 [Tyrophagus putrescentiae]